MAKILVVEDNPDLAKLYQRVFHKHETLLVETAWGAIAMLEQHRNIALVLLDMHLPEVSGLVVLEHIRKLPHRSGMNVFVISADDSLRPKAELIGIQFWMTKPVELDNLMEAAEPYLSASESTS